MSLTVHHLQVSQSERIPWLCEELGIDYELILHKRSPVQSPPSLVALHDMKAAPVIVDTTVSPPVTLAESGACAEYIAVKHGQSQFILPPSHPNYADYLYWFHYSNGNLQPTCGRTSTVHLFSTDSSDQRVQMFDARMDKVLRFMDARLSTTNAYLAGQDFSLADIMSVFSVTTMRKFSKKPFSLEDYPGILAWVKRCTDRPAYRAAMTKAEAGGGVDWKECCNAEPPALFEGFTELTSLSEKK